MKERAPRSTGDRGSGQGETSSPQGARAALAPLASLRSPASRKRTPEGRKVARSPLLPPPCRLRSKGPPPAPWSGKALRRPGAVHPEAWRTARVAHGEVPSGQDCAVSGKLSRLAPATTEGSAFRAPASPVRARHWSTATGTIRARTAPCFCRRSRGYGPQGDGLLRGPRGRCPSCGRVPRPVLRTRSATRTRPAGRRATVPGTRSDQGTGTVERASRGPESPFVSFLHPRQFPRRPERPRPPPPPPQGRKRARSSSLGKAQAGGARVWRRCATKR